MTPERWRSVERVYLAALECNAAEREAFLDQSCAGDVALRREVDALIAHGDQPSLLDRPAAPGLRLAIVGRLADSPLVPGRHAGRTFGAYELQSLVATGGMGEVYRAVDTRLNRTVAVKILPPHRPEDPEPRFLFRREAEIISSLNHPHICTMHDIGVQDGIDYLVMEYIEGQTLQQRLARGPIPVDQALGYAVQIVDALDKAHRRGIVHRDLKPANVMITTGGVKLLDFGIATRTPDVAGRPAPTEPARATPQYGSPEQLEDRHVDSRADLFSFGATAYEMLSGRPAFQGDSRADLVEGVLHREPTPIRDIRPEIPATLARTIMRCLAKDPEERWQTASDLLFELRGLASAGAPDPPAAVRRWLPIWAERAAWAATVLAAGLATLLVVWRPGTSRPAVTASPDIRFDLWPEAGASFASGVDVPFALSPDGRGLAYVAIGTDGIKRLWLRRFDGSPAAARAFPGTEDANTPFWSPDGEWVGCFDRHRLLKVHVTDGRVQVLAAASTMAGAAWNANGVILFPAGPQGLSRVAADGGALSPVTAGDGSHFWPQFLSDGEHFIYVAVLGREIRVGSLSGGASRVVMRLPIKFSSLGYVHGYVLYGHDNSLFARRFDETTLQFAGDEIRLLDRIPITQLGRMPFSVSAGGSLAFWRYPGGDPATLDWITDDGAREPVVTAPARYVGITLTADGRRAAFSRRNAEGGADVWLRDLRLSQETQLTFDGFSFAPRAATTGDRIALTSTATLPPLPRVAIVEPGQPTVDVRIRESAVPTFVSSWRPDGRSVVTVHIDPATRDDVYLEHLDGQPAERLSINTPGNDYQPAVAPDDRWIAYVSDASGRDEVWLASFPSGQVRHKVSIDGGTSPQWTAGGREISYISQRRWLTARSFAVTGATVALGSPRELVDASGFVETTPLLTPSANAYVAAPDGRRFLVAMRDRTPAPPIQVVVNWQALLGGGRPTPRP